MRKSTAKEKVVSSGEIKADSKHQRIKSKYKVKLGEWFVKRVGRRALRRAAAEVTQGAQR